MDSTKNVYKFANIRKQYGANGEKSGSKYKITTLKQCDVEETTAVSLDLMLSALLSLI